MKKLIVKLLVIAGILSSFTAEAYNNVWQQIDPKHVPSKAAARIRAEEYLVYSVNTQYLKDQLFAIGTGAASARIVALPMPDGSFLNFSVWQTPMMPAVLGAKYSDIKTFTATAADDPNVTAKLDFTLFGFHAMIFDHGRTAFIDPYNLLNDGNYMCHYKDKEYRSLSERMNCMVKTSGENEITEEPMQLERSSLPKLAAKTINGSQLFTYRLALTCSHQYAVAATGAPTPTKAQVMSAFTTSMNRINGVYERELSITMNFVPNEDTLIFTATAGDPFNSFNNNPLGAIDECQTICDDRIGDANYDLGHVFTTGSGGLSNLAVVCVPGQKAQSTTGNNPPVGDGFDIDYVAHEMGHEFGANHTFNNNQDGSCAGNYNATTSYEPGSGSTIMAYAGICDPDNIQLHSNDYFHAASLLEIYNATIVGTSCGVGTATGHSPADIAAFAHSYTIPYKTPFELMSPGAVVGFGDIATYAWDQWNLGDDGLRLNNTYVNGPIFRSFPPVQSTVRVFPVMDSVLNGNLRYVTVNNKKGEKSPDTTRSLKFRLTIRSVKQGKGCFVFPDDEVNINAVSTGAAASYDGFKVTGPSTAVNWTGGSSQSVTWNVVGSNAAPVNCSDVNIYLSADGGHTWPYKIGGTYGNNGSATLTMPNIATTTKARIKVKGNNNVFFNVNKMNFTLTENTSLPIDPVNNHDDTTVVSVAEVQSATPAALEIYPVPSGDIVHVHITDNSSAKATVLNTLGQLIWSGDINGRADIQVAGWAKGIYYIKLVNNKGKINTGTMIVK